MIELLIKLKDCIRSLTKKITILTWERTDGLASGNDEGGLLGIGEKDTDYVFGAGVDLEEELARRSNIGRPVVYEYNQGAQYETRNWCTVYSAVTEMSRLMNYKYSFEEIQRIGHAMIKDKMLDSNKGAYLSIAIDYTRRDWNKYHPDRPVESYLIRYSNATLRDILTHKHVRMTQIGYRVSSELFWEVQNNGYANKKNYPKSGGHATSQWGLATINNYKGKILSGGKPYRNRFSFTYIPELIKNGVIFDVGYMFLKKVD